MPQAETMPAGASRSPARIATRVHGWGGAGAAAVELLRPASVDELRGAVESCRTDGSGAIARGMGRSYGDAAQLGRGTVLDTTALTGYELDRAAGTVTAQAGVTLGELLAALVPQGWVVPVLPGTQHVTIAGAIASDIHGKNHGVAGTFGTYVRELGLLTADGEIRELHAADDDDGLLGATIGGMGLTGVILWARIALREVSSPLLSVDTDRVQNLDQALSLLSAPGGPHRVAWLDLLGSRAGRGVVTRAAHIDGALRGSDAGNGATIRARAAIPDRWPGGLLRPATVATFNELRFRRTPRSERGRVEGLAAHMFPLDVLDAWPRLYGRAGFLQYQFVVPIGCERVLEAAIEHLRHASVPCYLAVLKDFGPANEMPLSFPIAGWTLALDLPRAAPGIDAALDRLDELVAQAGGRVYLTKDVRMRADATAAMYPRLREWRAIRDGVDPERLWRSDLALRTGLIEDDHPTGSGSGGSGSGGGGRGTTQQVLLIGGSSEIGVAIVRRLAADGPVRPYLIGRDRARLGEALATLERDGCKDGAVDVVDATDLDGHAGAIARAFEHGGRFDVVVLAVGVLGAQQALDADPEVVADVMRVNFDGAGSLLWHAMRALRAQSGGTVVILSSVAAERPRSGNAIYGAAKAGLDALAQGLADASAGTGVRVLVVRPGFVLTRMTEGLPRAPFSTTADAVAEATVDALRSGARTHTIWVPAKLRYVFALLRHLPRPVYRRLPL
jgi:decaprenylphospho-beta-D-ribofuranose 2-oxidase